MKGKTFTYNFIFNTEIIELDKEIPASEMDDFMLWLKCISAEVGTGKHKEYYSYSENHNDDIGVMFYVKAISK